MKLFISLLFLGLVVEAEAGSCTDCEDTYKSSKTCDTLKTYLQCLETATGAGCPLPTAQAGQITQDVTDNSCTFDPLCVCQKNYWSTDISSGDPAVCTAAKARVTCLRGETGAACDGASAINVLGTTTDKILTDASCSPDAACTCEKDYVKADVSDDAKMCTQSLAFIGCLKGIEGNLCDGTVSVVDGITAADNVQKALTSPPCSPTDGCICEITYAKADVSNDANKCTEVKKYISCLKSKKGTGCDGTTTVVQLAEDAGTTAGAITGCTLTGTACQCELDYAKADISDDSNLCTQTKTYVNCLKDKGATGCVDSKSSLVTAAENTMSGIAGGACDITSTVCACDAAYAQMDTSTDALKCTANKNYISCLLGKTGTGCDGSTTLIASATAAESAITTIGATCTKTSVCDCEITYAKADISSNPKKCSEAKKFISCLKTKEGTGCDGSTTVASLATSTNTNIGTLSSCTKSEACECEVAYASADISDDIKKCTEVKKYISCLKSKKGTGCDGTTTVVQLAEDAGTTAGGITVCTLTGKACQCELDYAKADISDDTNLCTQTKTYVNCLKDKGATGCVDSKSSLVTAAENTMSGIAGGACNITSTVCACDAAYAQLDTSTDALKCTANKNYISCLLGKTGTGCVGSTTLIASATAAESAITTIGATCTKTSVCDCEITYAKTDISSDSKKCSATKDLTTCILLSTDNGCGASTTKTNVGSVASTAFTDLSTNCATTTTCDCQATFNAADVSNSAKCTSANALITCLDAITSTTETACDETQVTTELKTNVTTSVQAALCSFGAKVEASSFLAVLMMTISALVISL